MPPRAGDSFLGMRVSRATGGNVVPNRPLARGVDGLASNGYTPTTQRVGATGTLGARGRRVGTVELVDLWLARVEERT